ncbi:ankyrin repeat domain-containing protein [Candidatus Babeliales bacterium]|nr:ankyrin repeat domain-containing protein [Candidatus Babeliales bacterium]MBP9844390.1 ankyrin repeat domain-containing protein [Candidatus Babeliales bacterium]
MFYKKFIFVVLCFFHQSLFTELTGLEKALFEAVYAWDLLTATDILQKNPNLNLNITDKFGTACLHYAAHCGNIAFARLLIEHGADINVCDSHHITPLHAALQNNQWSMVKELLSYKNIDVNAVQDNGFTALHMAIIKNDMPMLKLLLTSPNIKINVSGNDGVTPLQVAVCNSYQDGVRILVEHGADVNILNVDHKNALHSACKVGNLEIVKMLLQVGNVDINCYGEGGFTPLQYAALFGYEDIVKELLQQKNIDIHIIDGDGCQPLYVAACGGYHKIVKMLLDAGADVNHADLRGAVALHTACGHADFKVVEVLLQSPEIDVNAIDLKGMCSLHWVAMHGYKDVLQLLLKNPNIDLNIQDYQKFTPLHYAIANYRRDIVHLLLQYKAHCDSKLRDELTPLYFAASLGFTDIVQELLIFGKADVNTFVYYEGFQGWTPLDIALENKHKQVQQLLLAHGAIEFRQISEILCQFSCAVGRNDIDQLNSFIAPKKNKLKNQILATVNKGFSMAFSYGLSSDFIQIINKNKIKVIGAFYAPTLPGMDQRLGEDRMLYFVFEKIDGKWLITDTDFSKKLKYFSKNVVSKSNKSDILRKTCESSSSVKNKVKSAYDESESDLMIYYPRQHYATSGELQQWNSSDDAQRMKALAGPW